VFGDIFIAVGILLFLRDGAEVDPIGFHQVFKFPSGKALKCGLSVNGRSQQTGSILHESELVLSGTRMVRVIERAGHQDTLGIASAGGEENVVANDLEFGEVDTVHLCFLSL
jgi:hypothetical protein